MKTATKELLKSDRQQRVNESTSKLLAASGSALNSLRMEIPQGRTSHSTESKKSQLPINCTLPRSIAHKIFWTFLSLAFVFQTQAGVTFLNPDRSGSDSYIIDNGAVPLGQKTPIILVHGVNLDGVPGSSLLDGWSNFIQYLNNDPELSSNFKHYQFAYKSNVEPIETLASNLAELLSRISTDSDFQKKPIVILAHSMGGLITRALLEKFQLGTQRKWSERVIRVITLGTPHHGTPTANDSGLLGSLGCALGPFYLVTAPFDAFKSVTSRWPSPYEVNRSELRWDNYNGLPCWNAGRGDQYSWVSDLNARSSASTDQKLIVYAGFMAQTRGHQDVYQAGEPVIARAIGMASDGVVPLQSALFDSRAVATTRIFSDYDHSQMWQGKVGDTTLFTSLRGDLLAAAKLAEPPRATVISFSPRTLHAMPIGQSQVITITGSGFTANSRLNFSRGATPFLDRVPKFISESELRYDISVGPDAASWTVTVVNGKVESLPYEFYVVKGGSELTGLSIAGPGAVTENNGAVYTAKAHFSDGSSPTVNAAWSVTGGSVSINASSGQLTAGNVNANSTVKVTASYSSGGITKSTSTDVMIVNSGSGGDSQTQQLIVNGNFASGGSSWSLTGAFQADSRFEICRSCPGYAYLSTATGAPGNNLSGTMSQTFTIPANATDVTLDYWHRTTTAELGGSSDRIGVQLRRSNGSLVGLDGISNADSNTAYTRRTVDLSGYKGQTVTLEFLGGTSPGAPTTFRIDDVSVIATVPIPKTPVLLGLGGPSSVQEGMTGQYDAVVVYSDGTVESVSPTWRENSNATTISSSGLLSAGSVSGDTTVTVSVTYPLGGVSTTVSKDVTIVNVAAEFSYLAINGPSTINENSSEQFTATAIYSNGSSEPVSPSWSVTVGPGSISNSGSLTVGEVSNNATVTVSASHTIDGVTRNASQQVAIINVPTPVTLVSLDISGPSSVNENGIAQYTTSASFSDGSSQVVIAQWNEDSPFISISSFGLVSAADVSSETRVTITASYIFGAVTRTASKEVTILDGSISPTLASLTISGPTSISENTTAQYSASASFSDGSTRVVLPTWEKNSAAIDISSIGLLSAGEVLVDTPVTISASYTVGNITRIASRDVTVINVTDTKMFTLTVGARNGTVNKNPNIASYTSGSTVVLMAVAAAEYQFSSWSGSASGSANPLTVTMDGNKEITANFTPIQMGSSSIVSWGRSSEGQTTLPPSLSRMVAIAAGGYHSLALTSDSTVVAWGRDVDRESTVPIGLGKVIKVVAGGYHSVALKSDGAVAAWGRNEEGQATVPLDLSGVTAIAAGYHHTLALKSNGVVVAWGRNADGEATVPAGLSGVVAIAGGGDHSLALRNDGTVVAWGLNSEGQGIAPAGLNGVTAIAAGADHNVALKNDGTVVAWGRNNQGQTTVPADLSGVIAIAAGGDHSVALRSNGTVVAWGLNDSGQTTVPAGLSGVTAIAAGFFHTVAFKSDGSIVAWGRSSEGQTTVPSGLGKVVAIDAGGYHSLALTSDNLIGGWGRDIDRESTIPIGLGKVIKVVAGGYHSVALKSDGAVAAWGRNEEGQATVPLDLSGVTAIAAGYHHTLALKSNGAVVAWGRNADGEATVPTGLTGVVAIAGGGDHSLALRNDGTVVAWGLNSEGQGIVPAGLNGVTAIAAGADHNVALKNDGTVVAWGRNNQGQTTIPADLSGVIAIAAGGDHSVALRSNGTVVAWGLNDSGQTTVPAGLSGVTAITAGFFHTVAFKSDGSIVTWGRSSEGQATLPPSLSKVVAIAAGGYHSLALTSDNTVVAWGRDVDRESTIPIGLGKVIKVIAGGYHSVALKSDGAVAAWGRNEEGQATVPLDLSGVTAIAAGYHHTLALKSDGTVVSWGRNADGEATVPAGLSGVVAIAGGGDHSLALRNDGTVVAWGLNSEGQGIAPAGLNGVIAIAAGADHNVALKNDGTVVAWGRNNQGQTTVPADLSGVIAIAAGGDHSVALRSNGTVVAWGLNDSGQTTVPAGLSGVTAIAAGFFHTVALVEPMENTPVLEITQDGKGVVLSWPSWATGFVLEVNGNLSTGESWTRIANGISASGDHFTFSDGASSKISFYRLRKL